jgi:hypothetical protein
MISMNYPTDEILEFKGKKAWLTEYPREGVENIKFKAQLWYLHKLFPSDNILAMCQYRW